MTVCVNTESLLGSLMSGNCLNLSGCGTGPRANCSAKGGGEWVPLALFSSVSSILIQSSMDFRESLNDSMFILEEPLLVMMITGRKLIMMTV